MNTNAALPTNERKTETIKPDGWVTPEFKISGAFSSNMVLQRDEEIKVWGFSTDEGGLVTGEFDGSVSIAKVRDGRFTLVFPPRPASMQPKTMRIRDDSHEVKFDNVLTGDVWVIGGQSNAEMNLRFCTPDTVPQQFDTGSGLRLFMQTQYYPYTHQQFCSAPQPDVINPDWRWRLPDGENSLSFSAIGWFIGKALVDTLQIPVGVINMSAGGACIRELVPAELAAEMGYDYGANVVQCGYYNTLINPFLGLKFRGMVFFQGESEGGAAELAARYCRELTRLVEDERARFGFDFPFYNVQISSYRKEGKQYFPYLETVRLEQFDALKTIPDSTLTVSMDLGSPDDWGDFAHSPKKKALSKRISDLILAKEYGIGSLTDASSPSPVSATVCGEVVVIKFADVCDGLISKSGGDPVSGFTFGGFDAQIPAEARITAPDTVEVTIPEGADASAVNYAYFSEITDENAQLLKSNGLPCPAFRIETL